MIAGNQQAIQRQRATAQKELMLFHTPDKTFKRLASCWKRAISAKPGSYKGHKLTPAWANCLLALDDGPTPENIAVLDWFALKVDEYSKAHMIEGDDKLSAILYEWKSALGFDPTKIIRDNVSTQ